MSDVASRESLREITVTEAFDQLVKAFARERATPEEMIARTSHILAVIFSTVEERGGMTALERARQRFNQAFMENAARIRAMTEQRKQLN